MFDFEKELAALDAVQAMQVEALKVKQAAYTKLAERTSEEFASQFDYSHHVKSLDPCFTCKAKDLEQFFSVAAQLVQVSDTQSCLISAACTSDVNPVKAETKIQGASGVMWFDFAVRHEYGFTGGKTELYARINLGGVFYLLEVKYNKADLVGGSCVAKRNAMQQIIGYDTRCDHIVGSLKTSNWYTSSEAKSRGHYQFTQYFARNRLADVLQHMARKGGAA